MKKVKELIEKQLSYEFDLTKEDFLNKSNIFTVKKHDENFLSNNKTRASIVIYKEKILVRSENNNLLKELKDKYANYPGQWFLEAKNMHELIDILGNYGLVIKNVFPVYAPKFVDEIPSDTNIFWLKKEDFEKYKGNKIYDFVFTYEQGEIGLCYKDNNKLIALISASLEARYFYDIGLEKYDFDKNYKNVGSKLLSYLTYHILKNEKERIPLCSTQFSHVGSLNLMVNAGYRYSFTTISID